MAQIKQTLPKGWRWEKLRDCATKIGSGITPLGGHANYLDSGIPLIRSQNVYMNQFSYEGLAHISVEQDEQMNKSRVFTSDVLLNITGASIGRVCVVPFNICPANVNQHVCVIRCADDVVKAEFLSFYLSNPNFQKHILDKQSGATRQALTKEQIENFLIPIPPLEEQKRITARLDEQMRHIEQARQAAEESLYLAWDLPSAYLKNTFESTDAQNWKIVKLGEILASTKNGLYKLDKYYGRGKPILKMYNIGRLDGTWNLERVDLIELTDNEYEDYRLNKGDILINRVNSRELVGKCAVINEKVDGAVYESKNIRIRLERERAEPEFVAAYINSKYGRDQFERSLKQIVGQATINRSDLDSFEIPLPSIDTQKQLMKSLNSKQENARALAASIESQLAEINELPSALLRQAFAGQL